MIFLISQIFLPKNPTDCLLIGGFMEGYNNFIMGILAKIAKLKILPQVIMLRDVHKLRYSIGPVREEHTETRRDNGLAKNCLMSDLSGNAGDRSCMIIHGKIVSSLPPFSSSICPLVQYLINYLVFPY